MTLRILGGSVAVAVRSRRNVRLRLPFRLADAVRRHAPAPHRGAQFWAIQVLQAEQSRHPSERQVKACRFVEVAVGDADIRYGAALNWEAGLRDR